MSPGNRTILVCPACGGWQIDYPSAEETLHREGLEYALREHLGECPAVASASP